LFFELQRINYDYVNLNPFLKNVVRRFGKAVEIRNSEINAMKDCLKNYSDAFSFHNGDQVKILSGIFKNKIGLVDQIENSYLTLLVNSLKIKLSYNTTKLKVV
jgi:transcription antitermination factor NusG